MTTTPAIVSAVRAANSLRITLDADTEAQMTFDLSGESICRDLANALMMHYSKEDRANARRKSLEETIGKKDSKSKGLWKWLKAYGIQDWTELDTVTLIEFKEWLLDEGVLCRSTIKAYLDRLAYVIRLYGRTYGVPCDDTDILKVKNENPHKTYLGPEDLLRLKITPTKTETEEYTKMMFLTCCYTGCRISDAQALTKENIQGNQLVYVSKKTKTQASVPLKPLVLNCLEWLWSHEGLSMTTAGYNMAIKRILERALVNDKVKVFKAGKELVDAKYKFVSSHTARISFATNLSNGGTPIQTISYWMGHSKPDMTMHYIVAHNTALNASAMQYFG